MIGTPSLRCRSSARHRRRAGRPPRRRRHRRRSRHSPPRLCRYVSAQAASDTNRTARGRSWRHRPTRRAGGTSRCADPPGISDRRWDRRHGGFRRVAEILPGERDDRLGHRACRRSSISAPRGRRCLCATRNCCSWTRRNRARAATPVCESKSWMPLPVLSAVEIAMARRLPRCFRSCHANSETLPNAVSRPVASWRRMSVAPGVLSSAPLPPPPRPPRPPPPLHRRLARCRAARGGRSLRRIVAHRQPRARRD